MPRSGGGHWLARHTVKEILRPKRRGPPLGSFGKTMVSWSRCEVEMAWTHPCDSTVVSLW
jgi:hypothetical protein